MKKAKIRTGIEIEAVLNRGEHPQLKIGEYHNGIKLNKYWKTERDGSLHERREFNLNLCCEFVSIKLKGKRGFKVAIDNFIKTISKNNLLELKDVLVFNNSCGCHLHLGLDDNKAISKLIDFRILRDVRKLFFKKITESDISEEIKDKIKNHYFRSYAKKLTPLSYIRRRTPRHSEFNIVSESEGKGLEWRSFNLNGVESWKDFKTILNIGFDCLYYLYKKRVCGYSLRKESLRINKSELKQIIEPEPVLLNIELSDSEVLECVI